MTQNIVQKVVDTLQTFILKFNYLKFSDNFIVGYEIFNHLISFYLIFLFYQYWHFWEIKDIRNFLILRGG